MATVLSPVYAATLADDVYAIKSVITREDFLEAYKLDMEIKQAKMATGVTGGYILNKPHVMAVFSAGKGTYNNQAFAAFKGTASLYDLMTDVNVGIGTSSTGLQVHQGFNRAFESVLTELKQFVAGLKGVTTIHCVGHSLGGAIATLAADWMKASSTVAQANLYTFGSPRVGLDLFSGKCTQRIGASNIYRAHHRTDPVPMLPTWPFFHVPDAGTDYLINSPVAVVPWEYHLMKHYISSAKAAATWQKLKSNRPQGYLKITVEQWLKSDGVVSLTANTLGLMEAALLYVLEKTANAAGILLVSSFSSSFTLLDRMAMLISNASKLSTEVSGWAWHLVKKMAALVGLTVQQGTNLTVEFIRKVFLLLHHRIADMVRKISDALD